MGKAANYNSIHINNIKVEENMGNICLCIEPGTFCTFNRQSPTNGVHKHKCYELCIVTSGCGEFTHGDQKSIIRKGDVFIAEPNVLHEIRIQNEHNANSMDMLQLFYFSINILSNKLQQSRLYEEKLLDSFLMNHSIVRSSQDHLISYMDFMVDYCSSKSSHNFGIYQAIKNIVLDSLLALTENKTGEDDKQLSVSSIIDLALEYIGQNLGSKIYIEDIAGYSKTSKRNLQHLFKNHMQCTVVDYIIGRRMSLASSFLRMNFKVSDVGNMVGIGDPAQFSRLFKKHFGISPKKFQMLYSPNGMVYGASY